MAGDNTDQLTSLGKVTQIVADTGDIEAIRKFKPVDVRACFCRSLWIFLLLHSNSLKLRQLLTHP
jgi:hypothetical protein